MAKTSLGVRDGNGNRNSSPTLFFTVWGHPRIPHVSKKTPHVGEKATTVRESGNEHDRFTVAVVKDKTLCIVCGESLVFLVIQDLSLFILLVVQCSVSMISETEHPS